MLNRRHLAALFAKLVKFVWLTTTMSSNIYSNNNLNNWKLYLSLTLLVISPVSSVSSLPYPSNGFHAIPLFLSPYPPRSLILSLPARMLPFSVTAYTLLCGSHIRIREKQPFFSCQERKFGNTGAADPRRSHETRERILRFCSSRSRIVSHFSSSLLEERSRSEWKISLSGFQSPVDESWSLPLPPREFLRLMERGRTI